MEVKHEAMSDSELETLIDLCIRELGRRDYRRCRRLMAGLVVDLIDEKLVRDQRI